MKNKKTDNENQTSKKESRDWLQRANLTAHVVRIVQWFIDRISEM